MKLVKTVAGSAFLFSALPGLSAVTLGETAAGFDLFLLSGTGNDETGLEFKETKNKKNEGGVSNFNGILGIGSNTNTVIEDGVAFGSSAEVWRHTSFESYDNGAAMPGGAEQTLGIATTNVVNTANAEILTFIAELNNLTAGPDVTVVNNTEMNQNFSFSAMTETSVLNFPSINMINGQSITLTGGPDDLIVIKIAGDSLFEGGAEVTLLGGLDRRNVVWLASDGSEFDLHQNETARFEGIIINPTADPDGEHTIIGDVDFKGQVFAGSLKMGSSVNFEGTNVPEPSGMILLLGGVSGWIFRRRRQS